MQSSGRTVRECKCTWKWLRLQACLQEPVNQTLKQVHIAFDTLLDILSIQDEKAAALRLPSEQGADFNVLLERTAADLAAMSAHLFSCKRTAAHLSRQHMQQCQEHSQHGT